MRFPEPDSGFQRILSRQCHGHLHVEHQLRYYRKTSLQGWLSDVVVQREILLLTTISVYNPLGWLRPPQFFISTMSQSPLSSRPNRVVPKKDGMRELSSRPERAVPAGNGTRSGGTLCSHRLCPY